MSETDMPQARSFVALPVRRWSEADGFQQIDDMVASEVTVQIAVAGKVIARLQCLPRDLEELGTGFVFTIGLAEEERDVGRAVVSEDGSRVDVDVRGVDPAAIDGVASKLSLASGCGKAVFSTDIRRGLAGTPARPFAPEEIRDAVRDLARRGDVFRETGAVHSASAWREGRCITFREDIARHNAIDKVAGAVIADGGDLRGCLLVSSGRLTAEVVAKGVRLGVWGIASRSAATDRAVFMAAELGVALVGFVRGSRMSFYCGTPRLGGEV